MARLLRVYCEACGTHRLVEIDDEYLRAASESPTGVIGVVDVHGDHAMVVYVDARGGQRGVRVLPLIGRAPAERAEMRLRLSRRLLSGLINILGFRLRVHGRFDIEGFRDEKASLSLSAYAAGRRMCLELFVEEPRPAVIEWLRLLTSMLAQRLDRLDPLTVLYALQLIDPRLRAAPPAEAGDILGTLLDLPSAKLEVDPLGARLYSLYAPRLFPEIAPLAEELLSLIDSGTLQAAILASNPSRAWELLRALAHLRMRGVVRLVMGCR